MTRTVHVLLPVHNRRALTLGFVQCLRRQHHHGLHLLLIDDGSTDGTADEVRAQWPSATIIEGDGSWWWAGSLQRGFDWLHGSGVPDDDVVLIANDDTEFDGDFVERALGVLERCPRSLLCARVRDPVTGAVRESGVHADLLRFRFRICAESGQINCLPTRGLFLRWGDMKRIGGFHPAALPHYWSDYEYTLRAHRLGYRLLTDASVVLRANAQSTGDHDLDRVVGRAFLRRLFSVKTPLNPVHRSTFVWFAAPALLKLPALLNVWARAVPRIIWQGLACRPFPRRIVASAPVADD